jgi:hypothetical protein
MDREYDLFEKLAEGASMWRGTIIGHDKAIIKLKELAKVTSNEVYAMHMPTRAIIAILNRPRTVD